MEKKPHHVLNCHPKKKLQTLNMQNARGGGRAGGWGGDTSSNNRKRGHRSNNVKRGMTNI
jgi:hypothetical protein